jgi:hypothetical protein
MHLQVTLNEAIAMHAAIVHYIRYFPPNTPMFQHLQRFQNRMIEQLPKTRQGWEKGVLPYGAYTCRCRIRQKF